jgi:hypothetical protein
MNRILDLQRLDNTISESLDAVAASTSSFIGCNCSTFSQSSCTPPKEIIPI